MQIITEILSVFNTFTVILYGLKIAILNVQPILYGPTEITRMALSVWQKTSKTWYI